MPPDIFYLGVLGALPGGHGGRQVSGMKHHARLARPPDDGGQRHLRQVRRRAGACRATVQTLGVTASHMLHHVACRASFSEKGLHAEVAGHHESASVWTFQKESALMAAMAAGPTSVREKAQRCQQRCVCQGLLQATVPRGGKCWAATAAPVSLHSLQGNGSFRLLEI